VTAVTRGDSPHTWRAPAQAGLCARYSRGLISCEWRCAALHQGYEGRWGVVAIPLVASPPTLKRPCATAFAAEFATATAAFLDVLVASVTTTAYAVTMRTLRMAAVGRLACARCCARGTP
jgi:hypothetical protein